MRRLHLAATVLAAGLLSACGEKPSTMEDLRSAEVILPNGTKIIAETMREQIDLTRGMMFRDSLGDGRGMLFINPREGNFAYTMYQVKIPLDIIWMDHVHRIVEIASNTPACPSKAAHECPWYGGHEKAQFVLELNAGAATKNGLRLGDLVNW